MSEPPKLLVNKPKKSQLKQVQSPPSPSPSSASPASASAPPPKPLKESFARRYKFVWPLLLAVNLSVGAYLFIRTKKKDVGVDEEVKDVSTSSVPTTFVNAAVTQVELVKPRKPIPEDQQRELFKWVLEEKRKIKPRDAEERKRIDEEKAILKQFISSKSIPTL